MRSLGGIRIWLVEYDWYCVAFCSCFFVEDVGGEVDEGFEANWIFIMDRCRPLDETSIEEELRLAFYVSLEGDANVITLENSRYVS